MEHITIILVSSDQEYGKALGLGLLHVCRSFYDPHFKSAGNPAG